jgi:hypothetical protein
MPGQRSKFERDYKDVLRVVIFGVRGRSRNVRGRKKCPDLLEAWNGPMTH